MSHGHKHPTGFEDYNRGRFRMITYIGDGTSDRVIYPDSATPLEIDLFQCLITVDRWDSTPDLSYWRWVYFSGGDKGWAKPENGAIVASAVATVDINENTITLNVGGADDSFNKLNYHYVMIIQGRSP